MFVLIDMKHAAISGLLMLFVGTGVVIWVEQVLASALVAILISAAPIWFVLMDKPMWKENFTNKISSKLRNHYEALLKSNDFIKDLYDVYENFFAYRTYLFDKDSKSMLNSSKHDKDYEYR